MSALGERPALGLHSHLQWSAIFAGAVAATGASLTLNAFGTGIGLSVVSSSPTWRGSSAINWLLVGVFLLFVAVISFSVGGYIAGRMRAPLNIGAEETEFRDGIHGLISWGITAILVALMAVGITSTAASGSSRGDGYSVAGETLIASELDELFRTDRAIGDLMFRRAEAARILLKSSSHDGVPNSDRTYLTGITSTLTGIPASEASERVNHAISASNDALHRARVAAVLQAFFIAAALLVGAVVAWFAATEGGKNRENGIFYFFEWRRRA